MKSNLILTFIQYEKYSKGDGKLQAKNIVSLDKDELAISYACLELMKKLNHTLKKGDIPPQDDIFKQLLEEACNLHSKY